MESAAEIERRLPLWVAFSDLFLDTELTEGDHKFIAKRVLESGYSPEEVVDILWLEVFPAVCDNLRIIAGEWAGFDETWLKDRIIEVINGNVGYNPGGLLSINQVISIIDDEWKKCCRHLPDPFLKTNKPLNKKIKAKKAGWFCQIARSFRSS